VYNEVGPDEVWNTVAICPDDHRRAHFGTGALSIRDELISFLSDAYPAAQILLREHARKMDSSEKASELIEEDFTS
jgi:hypothetical protein